MEQPYTPRFFTRHDRLVAGEKRVVTPANPAAGVDPVLTVPGGRQWRVAALRAIFTASGAVANRVPRIRIGDGSAIYWEGGQTTAITAGLAVVISGSVLGPQAPGITASVPSLISLPDLVLPQLSQIAFSTLAIDAADQWSAIAVLVEEFWSSDQALSDRHYLYDQAEAAAYAAGAS